MTDVPQTTFADFVAQRQRPLLRFAMVLSGDARLAEDIIADVLARAYERWPRIGALDRPDAYVRRMVVNEYLSWRRRARRLVPLDMHDVIGTDGTADHAARAEMITALAGLPRKQRATLVLRYYEGWSDADIADALGCTTSTVRSNAARALAALRIPLAEYAPLSRPLSKET